MTSHLTLTLCPKIETKSKRKKKKEKRKKKKEKRKKRKRIKLSPTSVILTLVNHWIILGEPVVSEN